jgi:hypothetical protein
MELIKHARDIAGFINRGDFERTEEGLLIHSAILGSGRYVHSVNGGQDEREDHNLIPAEGIAYFLEVALGDSPKLANLYLAVFSGGVTPAANWTAANFPANATEITSTTEGYSNATRPQWARNGTSSGGVIGNLSTRAVFNIVCTSTLNISGAALLSDNVRGGVAGKLISASRYGSVRVVNNGDAFELGYEVQLTDS